MLPVPVTVVLNQTKVPVPCAVAVTVVLKVVAVHGAAIVPASGAFEGQLVTQACAAMG